MKSVRVAGFFVAYIFLAGNRTYIACDLFNNKYYYLGEEYVFS